MHARNEKATGKVYSLGDYDRLSLFVSANGGEARHFRYTWLGRRSRMSPGTYRELSLRDAWVMRDDARTLLPEGHKANFSQPWLHEKSVGIDITRQFRHVGDGPR
ncbi:Arm DNA-binding domain-containing protein [Achromobacter aloeverae]